MSDHLWSHAHARTDGSTDLPDHPPPDSNNLLKLNTNKCEIVVFSRDRNFAPPSCEVEGSEMPVGDVGKCLGYWWKGDLLATRSVDENIKKARRAFFSLWQHWGISGRYLPPLLKISAGVLCHPLQMRELDFDRALVSNELVKRMLKWPKHLSNTAALTVELLHS